MSKHTPGPWLIDNAFGEDGYIRGPRGEYIADIQLDEDDPVVQANARLIAAAPDLLAALKSLVNSDARTAWDSGPMDEGWQSDELVNAWQNAERSITKAEGQS